MTGMTRPGKNPRAGRLSGTRAALIVSRLAVKRLLRGRVVWLSLALVALPAIAVALFADREPSDQLWQQVYRVLIVVLALLPPLYLAPAVGEEIDDNTFTYLWSRPFPRWSLLLGKLIGLFPIAMVILCAMVASTFFVAFGTPTGEFARFLWQGLFAMSLGTLATSALCVAVGTAIPRHATAISLIYLLVIDLSVSVMPFSIRELAIRHHVDELAMSGLDGGDIAWLAGMTAVWLGVAMWRITSSEYATARSH